MTTLEKFNKEIRENGADVFENDKSILVKRKTVVIKVKAKRVVKKA